MKEWVIEIRLDKHNKYAHLAEHHLNDPWMAWFAQGTDRTAMLFPLEKAIELVQTRQPNKAMYADMRIRNIMTEEIIPAALFS